MSCFSFCGKRKDVPPIDSPVESPVSWQGAAATFNVASNLDAGNASTLFGASEIDATDSDAEATGGSGSGGPTKLFRKAEKLDDKLVAVVITISQGASYDEIFKQTQPMTVTGEQVSTYSLACCVVDQLLAYLTIQKTPEAGSMWQTMLDDIRQVDADSVTFNWECCQGCNDSGFPLCGTRQGAPSRRMRNGLSAFRDTPARAGATPTMQLMGLVIRRGHTVMCSDFSMKALLAEWSEEHLGPNPFVKMGTCDSGFQLSFLPAELQNDEVPQQLQVVGELCADQGKAVVAAMSSTILYTVNPRRKPTQVYDLKVLTVVTESSGGEVAAMPEAMKCSIGVPGHNEKRGAAGHTTLTYASGGQLITSTGHWIELTRIDTSADSVLRVAGRNFGTEECGRFQGEYAGAASDMERQEVVQRWAKDHVSKSVPTRMKCRTKF